MSLPVTNRDGIDQSYQFSVRRRNGQANIVVAGGAGFVGSHLCKLLLDAGHRVCCVDNLQTGRLDNIEGLLGRNNFTFIEHDIIEPLELQGPVDEIYNLACPASPPAYQLDPIHTMKTCVLGSLSLLELARQKNARILLASTSEVYGDPDISPQPETYRGNVNTVGPRSCYDEGKRAAETVFYDYSKQYGLDVKIARIFNTYGPNMRMDDGRVVSNFITQALKGEAITIYGSGEQTRSFCYVDDLIAGLVKLMAMPKAFMGPVNLGNPNEFTINELAALVMTKIVSASVLVTKDLPVDDPKQRRPDISVADKHLNWQPKIHIKEGLDRTIAYFEREIELEVKKAQEVA